MKAAPNTPRGAILNKGPLFVVPRGPHGGPAGVSPCAFSRCPLLLRGQRQLQEEQRRSPSLHPLARLEGAGQRAGGTVQDHAAPSFHSWDLHAEEGQAVGALTKENLLQAGAVPPLRPGQAAASKLWPPAQSWTITVSLRASQDP